MEGNSYKHLLDKIFPFFIRIDYNGKVAALGSSLLKMVNHCFEEQFFAHFAIERPNLRQQDLACIVANPDQIYYVKHLATGLLLRGQFENIKEDECYLFLGTLWVIDIEELKERKLMVKDFALHDPTFDFLHIIKQSEIHRLELKELLGKLNKQTIQIKNTNKNLELLTELINSSSDGVQIAEESGRLYYINQTAAARLGIKQDECAQFFVKDFELIFQEEGAWEAHVAEVKDKGVLVIEGLNKHQETGQNFPVEVIVKYIQVADRGFVLASSRDITERKNAEKLLKETNQVLESIFNEMSDVIYSADVEEHKLLFITPSVEALLGAPPNNWYGVENWWLPSLHKGDASAWEEMQTQLKEKGQFKVYHRILTINNDIKWVRHKGKLIYNQNQEPIRIDGQLNDRSNQHKVEVSLHEELRLQEILIHIASTYINLDFSGIEETVKDSLKRLSLFIEADRAYIFDYDFVKGTASNTYEWCAVDVPSEIKKAQNVPLAYFSPSLQFHKEGNPFIINDAQNFSLQQESSAKSILEQRGVKSLCSIPMMEDGVLMGFVGFESLKKYHEYSEKEKNLLFIFSQMMVSIKNRQKWEKQLTLQEEKFRNIIANMKLGLLETDMEGRILFCNQSFCEISGYSSEELKGNKAIDIILKDSISSEASRKESYEAKIVTKSGEIRDWLVSWTPNYNDKGQQIGTIGIHLDITERKHLEKELAQSKSFAEAAAKAKELFLANMSHEIRTPLNVIIGMIRHLGKEDLSVQQKFYIKHSDSAAKHLLSIVNNILDISKIESGELELFESNFSVVSVVDNVYSILYEQTKEKRLAFNLTVSAEIEKVLLGDELRLKQVLINLIGNAIKFTETGFVSLSVSVQEESNDWQKLRFTIQDTGIGMSDVFITKIFDKFTQEYDSTTRKFEGTGLGMAIANDLVKLMGGKLNVASKKNEGTQFWFDLVFPIGDVTSFAKVTESVKKDRFKNCRLLLVEDNEMNRFIASQSITQMGFEIVEAENGRVAVELLQKEAYDLILMDIQMPEMDGVEATRVIRKTLKIDTPIIALTANAFKHDIELYMQEGMNDYIIKPYDEQDFLRKIEKNLGLAWVPPKEDNEGLKIDGKAPEKLYDLSKLVDISRGDQQFMSKILEVFCELVEVNTKILENAWKNRDIDTIKKVAHKMKPSVQQMQIDSIIDKVKSLEKAPLENFDILEMNSDIQDVSNTLKRVADAIKNKEIP